MADYNSGQATLFIQDDLTEPFAVLTCSGVGDISVPSGDLTPQYCPDPEHAGEFYISSVTRGPAGFASMSLTKPLAAVYNALIENKCGYNALITVNCEGVRDLPTRYIMAMLMLNANNTDQGISSPVAMTPDESGRINTTATVNFTKLYMLYNLEWAQQTLSNTADANGIAFLPEKCLTDCSNARGLCEIGFMGLDGMLYNSEVEKTENYGSTWAQTAADPFTSGGDAGKPVLFEMTDAERVVVPRVSQTGGEYAEISFTEDRGVTWSDVYVGTVDSQFLTKLFKFRGKLWAVGSHGYIYQSADYGSSWTAQEAGVETTEILRDGVMYTEDVGYVVGDDNHFLYTMNGGSDWASRTGPAVGADLLSVAVNYQGYVFVGASDGTMYYSTDRGVNWNTRQAFGVGTVPYIAFDNSARAVGLAIFNTAAPVGHAYRSIDAGASWQEVGPTSMPTNAGLNDAWICDQNTFIVAGEAYNGMTFVAKSMPVS